MPDRAAAPSDVFTLNLIAPVLEAFDAPDPASPPGDAWTHRYGIYTLAGGGNRIGTLALEREPSSEAQFRLRVRTAAQQAAGARHVVEGEYVCRADATATPVSWRYACRTTSPEGEPIPDLAIQREGRLVDGVMEIATPAEPRRRTMASPRVAANWPLFEAVQRLPRRPFHPLRFDLIDHFDQPKPGHALTYAGEVLVRLGVRRTIRETVTLLERGAVRTASWDSIGGEDAVLHRFAQHGGGVVPWVYWTDAGGRLLFAVSGIEAYVWEAQADEGEL